MDNRALALKLVLDHLGTTDISSVDNRMEVQKAVYLAQAAGVTLGYSYGWYVKGPYSPSLTRDYYNLSGDEIAQATLKATAVEKLDQVRALMEIAIDNLGRPQRLELLASLHYLIKVSGMPVSEAKKRLNDTKKHVSAFADEGLQLLRDSGLL